MDASALGTASQPPRAAASDHPGTVIRLYRIAANLTQSQLGARAGYSASTISRLEHGDGPIDDITVRRDLASHLNIPWQMLGLSPQTPPRDDTPPRSGSRRPPRAADTLAIGGGDLMRRRTVLGGVAGSLAGLTVTAGAANASTGPAGLEAMLLASGQPAVPLDDQDATTALDQARRDFAACRYDDLTRTLPGLLARLHATYERAAGRRQETVAGTLARAYGLASSVSTKWGDDALAWVLADRGLGAARQSGDALTIAIATNIVAITMRREGHHQTAIHLLTSTADGLGADRGNPTLATLSAYGRLLCTAAYSSAQTGDASGADTYITAAAEIADRLGGHLVTGEVVPFCKSTVTGYRISVHTALGDSASALHHAASIKRADIPTTERYGRYAVDTARAWHLHDRPDRATLALLDAERHAPGEVRRSSVRDLVTTMLYAPATTPTGLRDLAGRIGATAG